MKTSRLYSDDPPSQISNRFSVSQTSSQEIDECGGLNDVDSRVFLFASLLFVHCFYGGNSELLVDEWLLSKPALEDV